MTGPTRVGSGGQTEHSNAVTAHIAHDLSV